MPVQEMSGAQRFLAAARRQNVDRTPVWFMRQAGRSLASYRALREEYDLLTMARTPELATQVTLLPVDQLGVDAAVLYSDIMLPLVTLGVEFRIDPGVGPVIPHPIRERGDVEALRRADPRETIPEIFEAVAMIHRALGDRAATLGFAGAPFTVASYMIEGRSSKEYARTKAMMLAETPLWHALMATLTEVTIAYLHAQIDAGADAVQLFDSWAGALSRDAFREHVLPYTTEIVNAMRGRAPVILFGTNMAHLLDLLATADPDVISVDWRLPLQDAWQRIGERAIQGNLDPVVLSMPWDVVEREARVVLGQASGREGHIFNLGHGVLPQTPEANLERLVAFVHESTLRTAV